MIVAKKAGKIRGLSPETQRTIMAGGAIGFYGLN
jgi:hypothetical protein